MFESWTKDLSKIKQKIEGGELGEAIKLAEKLHKKIEKEFEDKSTIPQITNALEWFMQYTRDLSKQRQPYANQKGMIEEANRAVRELNRARSLLRILLGKIE